MEESPLVTVYIPTYNRLNLLHRAVESVLNQDYQNIELIVVDDGSNDGTVDYLEELAGKESRVRYFVNAKNSGACVSRNRAIFFANGEFITGLDDDDYFLPARIRRFLYSWARKRKKTVALFSNAIVCSENGIKKSTRRPKIIAQQDLVDQNYIGNQVFTTVKALRDIGGFDIELPILQDLDAWYRLLGEHYLAERISYPTYVVDKSHPHERIGLRNGGKVKLAFQRLSRKYELTSLEESCFKIHILGEDNIIKRKVHLLHRFFSRPTLRNFFNFIAH